MNIIQDKGKHRCLVLAGTIHTKLRNCTELLDGIIPELLLIALDILQADTAQIIHRFGHANGTDKIGCSGFEFEWQNVISGFLKGHLVDHIPSSLIWRQPFEPFFLAIEHADPGGSIDFMSGKCIKIAIQISNVNRFMLNSLSAIKKNRNTMAVRDLYNFLNRIYGAKNIGNMGYGDDTGTVEKRFL